MMTAPVDLLTPAAAGVALSLFALKLRWPRLGSGDGWAHALVTGPVVAGASGILLAWSAPQWLQIAAEPVARPFLLFLAGWVGLRIGCGLDLRVARRTAPLGYLAELGTALAAALAVVLLAFALSRAVPGLPAPQPGALLVLAGLCVAGRALPGSATAVTRGASRGGFWTPSAAAFLGVLLAGIGTALGPALTLQPRLPWTDTPILLGIDGTLERLLWGLSAGCMTGLVADLATKDDFAPGGLYPQLAAVVLIAAGVAGATGLEVLLVGSIGGFWLINATLRRLDILHVVERGSALPKLAAPFAVGWLVGEALRGPGVDGATFGLVLVVVLGLRPATRLLGTQAVLAALPGTARRRGADAAGYADLVAIDELGILLAATLIHVLEPAAAAGGLAAVLLAQALLGAWGRWRDGHRAAQRVAEAAVSGR